MTIPALAGADDLPIAAVLPALKAALGERSAAVLVAPPGAGKTTVTPLALLGEDWVQGRKLILLEPRRLAARAAASRMAGALGEDVGATVGYRVRLDTRVTAATRIEVVTEGVFTRMVLGDPGLEDVAGVIFDEFHERSLDGDLGLALAFDSQTLLREDLRLLVMSATLDGARIAASLGDAPVIESVGRQFDIATRYLGKDPRASLEEQVVVAIRRALQTETGGVLVFLPGAREINRVARRLEEEISGDGVDVAPLYGALDVADQDRAVAPAAPGRRKVVLATAIAQTSLTLEGIRVVIDSGLSRVPRWDVGGAITRLTTVRASRATIDQRRGRAGRTGPGLCWRLWDEAETRALPAFDRPEILEADLSGLALDLARWGAGDGAELAFLDRPPAAAMAEARRLLSALGALDADGHVTADGLALGRLPLPPRLAHMILMGARRGQGRRAALLAVLLTEQGLGGQDTDITHRLDALGKDRGRRARAAVALAERWSRLAGGPGPPSAASAAGDGLLLALAFPDRIAKARGGPGEFQLAGGRGVFLDPPDSLAREAWLAVADLGAGPARDRILLAARLDPQSLRAALQGRLKTETRLVTTPSGALRGQTVVSVGELVVEEGPLVNADPDLVAQALLADVRRRGLGGLAWGEGSSALRARVAFLRRRDGAWPDLTDEGLMERLDDWLEPLVNGRRSLGEITAAALQAAVTDLIPWSLRRDLETLAPPRWTAPTGSAFAIDYAAEGGPRVAVRVQEVFGLARHPTVAGEIPLTLALLSPARREIQVTRDLPQFWAGSWSEVRKSMRGRYPKHPWPEDPATAPPTSRAKPRS